MDCYFCKSHDGDLYEPKNSSYFRWTGEVTPPVGSVVHLDCERREHERAFFALLKHGEYEPERQITHFILSILSPGEVYEDELRPATVGLEPL